MEQTTLYHRQGGSDKVYQAQIEPKDGGFVVNFAFGRRGSALQTGTKTSTPVSEEAARRIFAKLIQEKQAKGYTPGEDGTPYQHTDKANQATGVECQLLNVIDEDAVTRLIHDPGWCMQEKFDGRRMLIRKTEDGEVTGINRRGLIVALPGLIAAEAKKIPGAILLDGECLGDRFMAFDVLDIGSDDARNWTYKKRFFAVGHGLADCDAAILSPVEGVTAASDKGALFQRLKEQNKEGVVFKRLNAPYTGGRPASGGDQFKFKFCESASFMVSGINAKRSVSLVLFVDGKAQSAGNVTVPANQPIPQIGKIVEVRYLYAFRESGCIFQPVFLGLREDITPEDCTVDQLKFKADPQEKAA